MSEQTISTPEDTAPDSDVLERVRGLSGTDRPVTSGTRRKQATARWVRWIHVYTSMISLLVVLFFGLTGITLNHPDWTFGGSATKDTTPAPFQRGGTTTARWTSSTCPSTCATTTTSKVPFRLHEQHHGRLDQLQGSWLRRRPALRAYRSGTFTLTIEQQGFVAVMNDIHKGRDTDASWGSVIDVSGGFLVVVAVTGLGIQIFQKKRRRSSLIIAGVATFVTLVLIYIAMRSVRREVGVLTAELPLTATLAISTSHDSVRALDQPRPSINIV